MRVLWLCHFVPFPATGHGALQRTHHLVVQTSRRLEVGVIALSRDAGNSASLKAGLERAAPDLAFVDVIDLAGVQKVARAFAVSRSMVSAESFWVRELRDARAHAAVRERVAQYHPDVLHLDTIFLSDYLAAAPGLPAAITHHNIESDLLLRRAETVSGPLGVFFRREARKLAALERDMAPAAAANIMVSDADAGRLAELAPAARTVVVPNGVDVEFFRGDPMATPTESSMVFVGGMDWYPNRLAMEWLAAELWPALAADKARRRVTIVGRRPPPALEELAARDQRVTVTGFVDDVRPYMNAAAVYICPIKVGGGTRLKILDALAMGRPLVSTELGVSGIGLHDGEHYLRAETAADFVSQVTRLESDPQLAAAIARNGRRLVEERFAWPPVADALVRGLERVAKSRA